MLAGGGPAKAQQRIDLPPEALTQIRAQLLPRSTTEWRRFNTLHEAALYGAQRLEDCSHYYECSGFIDIDPKGKFVVGPVRTDYNSNNVNIHSQDGPSDWKLAGDLHSHPCVPRHDTGLFSPADMIGSLVTRTTSFMVDLCTGDVHEFIPGVTKPDEVHGGGAGDIWMTPGNIIGRVAAFKDAPIANEGI